MGQISGKDKFCDFLSKYIQNNPKFHSLITSHLDSSIFEYFTPTSRSYRKFLTLLKNQENSDLISSFYLSVIKNCAIWLPLELYSRLPIIFPYTIRGRVHDAVSDNWGEADSEGFMLDDNSDIKDYIRSVTLYKNNISTNEKPYSGYTACHIWPKTTKDPYLFSFIGNIVFLPAPVAKLSDNENSLFSYYLKQAALSLYRPHFLKSERLKQISQISWDKLLKIKDVGLNDGFKVEEFCFSNQNIDNRIRMCLNNINQILNYIEKVKLTKKPEIIPDFKLIHSRYAPSLKEIIIKNPDSTVKFENWLSVYKKIIE